MASSSLLFVCTGNSCRSQMAEGFARRRLGTAALVASAGTEPAATVHPRAIAEMARRGIDISAGYPKRIAELNTADFDLVITVCDHAQENCPVVPGAKMLHWSFPDPADAVGTEEEVAAVFRRVADDIEDHITELLGA